MSMVQSYTLTQNSDALTQNVFPALIGLSVIFILLALLVIVFKLLSKNDEQDTASEIIPEQPAQASVPVISPAATTLDGVNNKTAAMLMAIVAHKMNAPLHTLRFISIKKV